MNNKIMEKTKYYIGTAGWSYKDWEGVFYPDTQERDFDMLSYYARYFNSVEVNATYYTYVSPATAGGWLRKTEDYENFLFDIKLHQDFTHKRNFTSENRAAVERVLNMLRHEGKLGGLLVQFPYSFAFTGENAEYLSGLMSVFGDYKLFIEVRHNSWKAEEIKAMDPGANVVICSVDQPEIGKSLKFVPVVMNGLMYIRLHGRNTVAWKNSIANLGKKQSYEEQNERYRYLYSTGELVEIIREVFEIKEFIREAHIIFNNHPGGNAAANAMELLRLLEGRLQSPVPQEMLRAFPHLRAVV